MGAPENSSPFQFGCAACGSVLKVPTSYAGRKCKCPSCQTTLTIPHPAIAQPVSPVSPHPVPQQAPPQPPVPQPPVQQPLQPLQPLQPQPPVQHQPMQAPVPPPADDYQLAPLDGSEQQSSSLFPSVNAHSTPSYSSRRQTQSSGGGAFAPEQKGLQAGVLGGLAMMAIAVIWFFAGLAAGYIFFYPPILFIIGLVGMVQGLATGNMAGGGGNRRRRY